MKLKIKLALGLVLLFGLLLIVSTLGLVSIHALSNDAGAILKDNYQTLEYVHQMQGALNVPMLDAKTMEKLVSNLEHQRQNITEPGEQEVTDKLTAAFETLLSDPQDSAARARMLDCLLIISDLNLKAISTKNALALDTAEKAAIALGIITTFCLLIGFVFVLNFPHYIADPIRQLAAGLQEIAKGNYRQHIHLKRHDEFGELADVFNTLAAKLDAYEHSNLARILFEKKRLETIIGAMHDPVVGLDENYRVLFANEPALTLLHLAPSKLIGKDAREVALTNDLLRNLLKRMAQLDAEPIKIFANGKESFFQPESLLITAQTGPDNRQQGIGHVLILKNVTAFRERDVAKTHFIATISHEIKTPISSIKMGLKLLNDARIGTLNEEQQHLMRQLEEDAGRILAITGELLKLAQAETGNIVLNIMPTAPYTLVETACRVLWGQAKAKNIAVETIEMPAADVRVLADEDKATWVLVNLLANAVRYSPSGETVRVFTSVSGIFLRIAVQDNGPGIPSALHSSIFERFFKVPGSGTDGTGLGLAISREFVWAMGGDIGVISEPGQGSTFWFTLPLVRK